MCVIAIQCVVFQILNNLNNSFAYKWLSTETMRDCGDYGAGRLWNKFKPSVYSKW